ncbi:MAG: hypothetical protein DRH37_05455, partial [Deltaproteobacteria bacterium]
MTAGPVFFGTNGKKVSESHAVGGLNMETRKGRAKTRFSRYVFSVFFTSFLGILMSFPVFSRAADSLCAVVKIEIRQELTLERQAFDAYMRIRNGLSHVGL